MIRTRLLFPLLLVLAVIASSCSSPGGSRAREVRIRYGEVVSVSRVPVPSAAPAGAMVGGFTGLMLARHKNPGRQLAAGVGGAALGGLVTKAIQGDRRAYRYEISYVNGDAGHYITENGFLQPGDCIAVERGNYANLRRVANVMCQSRVPPPPEMKHRAAARQCDEAKDQLVEANTEEQVNVMARKVKILCQF